MTALARELRDVHARGRPIVVAAAGSGVAARHAARGGAHVLAIYSSSRLRSTGLPSLAALMPYANANELVLAVAGDVLSNADGVPVVAGICATDPFHPVAELLGEVARLGFAGVQNFPSVGLVDGDVRRELEEARWGVARELEAMRAAASRALTPIPFVFSPDQAALVAPTSDVVAAHVGPTRAGCTVADTAQHVGAIANAARAAREDVLVLFHGGAAVSPAAVEQILRAAHVDGVVLASVIERDPDGAAIESATRSYVELSLA